MNLTVTRREIGGRDTTVIDADEFPSAYVDHSRNWIEISEDRFSTDAEWAGGHEATPAEVVAWLRAVADAIEKAAVS
jgi:hypothetical protein